MAKMAKTKAKLNANDDLQEIRQDLDSLKHNVVALSKNLKNNGSAQVQEQIEQAKKVFSKRWGKLQSTGKVQMKRIETQVRAKPAQALGVAFLAGLAASILLRRG